MKFRSLAVTTFATLSLAGCGGSKKPSPRAIPPAPHTHWERVYGLEGWGNANLSVAGERIWMSAHAEVGTLMGNAPVTRYEGVKGDAPQVVCESNGRAFVGGFSIETSPNVGFIWQGPAASGTLAPIKSATKLPAIYSMYCDEKLVYAVGNWDDKTGGLLRASSESDSSVLEWTRVPLDVGGTRLIKAHGAGDDIWVIGDGGLVVNGANDAWKKVPSGVTVDLKAVVVAAKGDVYVAGENGTLIHTTDGGASWKPIATGTTDSIFAVHVEGNLLIVGTSKGDILVSEDGGAHFVTEEAENAREGIREFVRRPDGTLIAITPDALISRVVVK